MSCAGHFDAFRVDLSAGMHIDLDISVTSSATWCTLPDLQDRFPDCRVGLTQGKATFDRADFSGSLIHEEGGCRGEFTVDGKTPGAYHSIVVVCLAYLIARQGRVLLHASGVIHDGRLWLFSGLSGRGKTTIVSDLRAGGDPFSVDRVVLFVDDRNRLMAYPTPISDEFGLCPARPAMPVFGVAFIEQADGNELQRLDLPATVRQLFGCVLTVCRDEGNDTALLHSIEQIAATRRFHRLKFRRDESFWSLLNDVVD